MGDSTHFLRPKNFLEANGIFEPSIMDFPLPRMQIWLTPPHPDNPLPQVSSKVDTPMTHTVIARSNTTTSTRVGVGVEVSFDLSDIMDITFLMQNYLLNLPLALIILNMQKLAILNKLTPSKLPWHQCFDLLQ